MQSLAGEAKCDAGPNPAPPTNLPPPAPSQAEKAAGFKPHDPKMEAFLRRGQYQRAKPGHRQSVQSGAKTGARPAASPEVAVDALGRKIVRPASVLSGSTAAAMPTSGGGKEFPKLLSDC